MLRPITGTIGDRRTAHPFLKVAGDLLVAAPQISRNLPDRHVRTGQELAKRQHSIFQHEGGNSHPRLCLKQV